MERLSPPIKYFGSKANMAEDICAMFGPHRTFVDVFGGSAAVLFAHSPTDLEVYNDLNDNLVNLFRVLRDATLARRLERALWLTPYARVEFDRCVRALRRGGFTDGVEWARCTFAAYNMAVRGKVEAGRGDADFSTGKGSGSPRSYNRKRSLISQYTRRMATVLVEHLTYEEVIQKYDAPETAFYIDPPYVQDTRSETLSYEYDLRPHEHKRLVDLLLSLKGQAVVSGYDHPYYARLTSSWPRKTERVVKVLSSTGDARDAVEILWCNRASQAAEKTQRDLTLRLF